MKRDMDLIRDILLAVEERANGRAAAIAIEIPGRSETEVSYHIQLMHQAGLVEATDVSSPEQIRWLCGRMTWEGQDFLCRARHDTRWERAKTLVAERGGCFTLDFLNRALQHIATEQLGL